MNHVSPTMTMCLAPASREPLPPCSTPTREKPVRSIFMSDIHLGCKYSRAEEALGFLRVHEPQHLYLVGDILDGWRLKRNWFWKPAYSRLVEHVVELAETGTQVIYLPGNHDEFLRTMPAALIGLFDRIELTNEAVHETVDGRRLLILHGDQFDHITSKAHVLSHLGDVGYNALLDVNHWLGRARTRMGLPHWSLSHFVKRKVKEICKLISRFEDRVVEYAERRECDGVVCGHIHVPTIAQRGRLTYYNTGDWVENCSALVEYLNGDLALVDHLGRPMVSLDRSLEKSCLGVGQVATAS